MASRSTFCSSSTSCRAGGGRRLLKTDLVARPQRRDLADAQRKQIAFTLARCPGLGLGGGQRLGLLAGQLELARHARQVLQ
jgi:hypothetical protein